MSRLSILIGMMLALSPLAQARTHAILIGNSAYETSGFMTLPGVKHDLVSARQMAESLGATAETITELRDAKATTIQQTLAKLKNRLSPQDQVFVYYSGHGTRWYDETENRCAEGLLATDGQTLSQAALASLLEPLAKASTQVLTLIDACFSGGVIGSPLRTRSAANEDGMLIPKFQSLPGNEACARPSNFRLRGVDTTASNLALLASTQADEVAFDSPTLGGYATVSWRDCLLSGAEQSTAQWQRCAQQKLDDLLAKKRQSLGQHLRLAGNPALRLSSRPDAVTRTAAPAIQIDDAAEITVRMDTQKVAEWRAVVAEPWSDDEERIWALWQKKLKALRNLGDRAAILKTAIYLRGIVQQERYRSQLLITEMDYVTAVGDIPRALVVFAELEKQATYPTPLKIRHMINLANLYKDRLKLAEAKEWQQKAKALLDYDPRYPQGDWLFADYNLRRSQTMVMNQEGLVEQAIASYESMPPLLERIRQEAIIRNTGKSEALNRQIENHMDLASTLITNGQYGRARTQASAARRLIEESQDLQQFYKLAYTLGRIEYSSGNFLLAERYLREALALNIQQSGKNSDPSNTSRNWLRTVLLAQERFPEALALWQQQEQLDPQKKRNIAINDALEAGMAHFYAGDPETAVTYFMQDAALAQKRKSSTTPRLYLLRNELFLRLSLLQREPDDSAAQKEMIEIVRELLVQPWPKVVHAHDRQYLRLALRAFVGWVARQSNPEPEWQELAFRAAEWIRESSVPLSVEEAAARQRGNDPQLAELTRAAQDARQSLNTGYEQLRLALRQGDAGRAQAESLQKNLAALEAQKQRADQAMRDYCPGCRNTGQPTPPTMTQVAATLKPGEVWISILPDREYTYVWAIDHLGRCGFHVSELTARQIGTLVDTLRDSLKPSPLGTLPPFATERAAKLYRELLAPLRTIWGDGQQLLISADGALSRFPLAALPVENHWLVETHAISQAPSAAALLALRQLPANAGPLSFMGFGDPDFGIGNSLTKTRKGSDETRYGSYQQLPALPETRQELQTAAQVLGANPEQSLLLGKAATREAVLAAPLADKRIVAFSTHGLQTEELDGLTQPALALSGTDNRALLQLEDVMKLKLNADWVLLAACNTAAGSSNEALTGLARGFFYAGARSLLVTHWSVETESTRELIGQALQSYASDPQQPRAQAVRTAQRAIMKQPSWQHPYYWAGFEVAGDGGR